MRSIMLNNPNLTEIGISSLTDLNSSSEIEFPFYLRIWVSVTIGILLCVGTVGNILVPLLVWRSRDLRQSTNVFLINLAIADLLVILVCLPTTLVDIHSPPETWVMGNTLCRLIPFLEMGVEHASVLTLLVISVERYVAICQPLRSTAVCTRSKAGMACAALWGLAILATSPVIEMTKYSEREYIDGSKVMVCILEIEASWTNVYLSISMVLFSIVPLVFLTWIYTVISRQLLAGQDDIRSVDNPRWKARKQVVYMLVAVIAVFFVCTLPYRILVAWQMLSSTDTIQNLGMQTYYNLYYMCRVLLYINSAANPIIYNAMSSKYRKALFRLLRISGKPLRRQSTLTTTITGSSSLSSSLKRRASHILWRRDSDSSMRKSSLDSNLYRSSPGKSNIPKDSGSSEAYGISYKEGDSSCLTAPPVLSKKKKVASNTWMQQGSTLLKGNDRKDLGSDSAPFLSKRLRPLSYKIAQDEGTEVCGRLLSTAGATNV